MVSQSEVVLCSKNSLDSLSFSDTEEADRVILEVLLYRQSIMHLAHSSSPSPSLREPNALSARRQRF